jgi:hypothetical protein
LDTNVKPAVTDEWFIEAGIAAWLQYVLNSFRHWTGRELIERRGSHQDQARALFDAPFVVVSHGSEKDPILNYGNRAALDLWECTWEAFSRTPSRMTAEPMEQDDRERLLARTRAHGFIDDYQGIRISSSGRRFFVENAVVWNVFDEQRRHLGQAATFSRWRFL